jgi:hypothetical protein
MSDKESAAVAAECAHTLRCIANDLRSAGDVPLVMLDEDGVAPADISLADELWLIALRLDGRLSNDEEDIR